MWILNSLIYILTSWGLTWGLRLALLLALLGGGPARAAQIQLHTTQAGDAVTVQAQASIAAPLALVWATLTDYERLPEFVPGLKKSKVIARNGPVVVVQQSGEARFLFASVPIEVTLESTEAPPTIEARLVSGNMRQLNGRYEVQEMAATASQPAHVVLRWTGTVEPMDRLPPLVGEAIVRRQIRQQFAAMVGEIERLEALRPAPKLP
jgi:ribosome-associated toxin RatA of RatAB toxin-antitoxin module